MAFAGSRPRLEHGLTLVRQSGITYFNGFLYAQIIGRTQILQIPADYKVEIRLF